GVSPRSCAAPGGCRGSRRSFRSQIAWPGQPNTKISCEGRHRECPDIVSCILLLGAPYSINRLWKPDATPRDDPHVRDDMTLVEVAHVNIFNDGLRIHSPSQASFSLRGELDCLG